MKNPANSLGIHTFRRTKTILHPRRNYLVANNVTNINISNHCRHFIKRNVSVVASQHPQQFRTIASEGIQLDVCGKFTSESSFPYNSTSLASRMVSSGQHVCKQDLLRPYILSTATLVTLTSVYSSIQIRSTLAFSSSTLYL